MSLADIQSEALLRQQYFQLFKRFFVGSLKFNGLKSHILETWLYAFLNPASEKYSMRSPEMLSTISTVELRSRLSKKFVSSFLDEKYVFFYSSMALCSRLSVLKLGLHSSLACKKIFQVCDCRRKSSQMQTSLQLLNLQNEQGLWQSSRPLHL